MTTVNEIQAAIASAIEAYNAQPDLLRQIEDLKAEVELLNGEVSRLHDRTIALENTIADQSETIGALRQDRARLQDDLATTQATVVDFSRESQDRSIRITELEADVFAKHTLIELLEADKASLQSQLDDRKSVVERLTTALKGIMVDVSAVIPAPVQEVTTSATFPNSVGDNIVREEPVTGVVAERSVDTPVPVVDEVKIDGEPKPIAEPIYIYQSQF